MPAHAPDPAAPVRVLVADDSSFMRRLLSQALREQGFEVVGEAADGDEALALWRRHRPDAMTLDLAMPGMDGIGVLRALRADEPRRAAPVVVVSAFSPAHGARAVDALAEGAFDLVAKPAFGDGLDGFVASLRFKVIAAAQAGRASLTALKSEAAPTERRPGARAVSDRVVVLATSTGGPRALADITPHLPPSLGAGGVIVQHMPAGFTGSLAARLDRVSPLHVREANSTDRLDPGTLLVTPGGRHLRFDQTGAVRLTDDEPIGGLRPRADLTISDAAKIFGERVLLVVMTGMGRDGLAGAREVRARGGRILVEAERTCTVFGMPRAIAEAGLADEVLGLDELPAAIAGEVGA